MTTIGSSSRPAYRTWGERFVGAALLDSRVYARAADDPAAVAQGALVVLLAGVSQGLATGGGRVGLVLGFLTTLVGWPLWALMIQVITGQRGVFSRLLRVLGLAHMPAILSVAGALSPGRVGVLVVWMWSLAAAVVGVRAALRCTLRKAVILTVITWLALMLAAMWVGATIAQAMAMGEYLEGY